MVVSSRRLIGVHVSSCWHRAPRGTNGGSEGGSSAGGASSDTATEPPDVLEVDILNLWTNGQAETPDHMAAQESNVNIPVSHTRG